MPTVADVAGRARVKGKKGKGSMEDLKLRAIVPVLVGRDLLGLDFFRYEKK